MNEFSHFLTPYLGNHSVSFLASDMSDRTYYRVTTAHKTYVLMHANVPEELRQFIKMTQCIQSKKLRVPHLFHQNLDDGLLLMEDFGDNTLSKVFKENPQTESVYLKKAIDILDQTACAFCEQPQELNPYDQDQLMREVHVFSDYYFLFIRKENIEPDVKNAFGNMWEKAFQSIDKLTPNTLVLRDYHVDNLMVLDDQTLGLLDYQDALWGSVVYDYISLIEDARRDLNPTLKRDLEKYYLKNIPKSRQQDYLYTADILGAGRHAKVLGVFTRYALLRNNESKLIHLPRVASYLINALKRCDQQDILYFLNDQKLIPSS
ncbi:MAG: N-acetylmuramate/N-acetylglucosamine kinase [Holosporales bacterium]